MAQSNPDNPLDYGKGTGEGAKDRLRDMADTATDKLKGAGESAQQMAGKVAEQAREYGDKAQDAAQQIKPFVERSLREQPMATLAGVAVIGFVLGALWKK